MKNASSKESSATRIVEWAETQIRLIVKNGYLQNKNRDDINREIDKVLKSVLPKIKIERLRKDVYQSLNAFATRQYRTYVNNFGADGALLLALSKLSSIQKVTPQIIKEIPKQVMSKIESSMQFIAKIETKERGVALSEYSKEYMKNRVMPVFENLVKQTPLDPKDVSGHNSLRNKAEMEVRYQSHIDSIAAFKAAKIKFVTTNVYANCSKRCAPFQGKIYSLDGTTGAMEDGTAYEPLKNATNVPYITKAGVLYMNGLLGFNCRHKLIAYVPGMQEEFVSEKARIKQYAIDKKQRELETHIRYWRNRYNQAKNVNLKAEQKASKKVDEWLQAYKKFSVDNNAAIYIERTKI